MIKVAEFVVATRGSKAGGIKCHSVYYSLTRLSKRVLACSLETDVVPIQRHFRLNAYQPTVPDKVIARREGEHCPARPVVGLLLAVGVIEWSDEGINSCEAHVICGINFRSSPGLLERLVSPGIGAAS